MATPYPTWKPGLLAKNDRNLIQVPEWIANGAAKEWIGYCTECFKEGYIMGWTNATDQFREGDIRNDIAYVLKHRNLSDPDVQAVIDAAEGTKKLPSP
jgi:hypothetical protein